ncbi:MAG TPA: TA system VapC family ribonuclease toxin [Bryobacteraceae bacterium]|nr:TA system VapC family ribonuclease toxin [Bryobacteraceae bacterium]
MAIPDINVWVALAAEHIHRTAAVNWWRQHEGSIGFCRMTQVGLLRLLTTAAVMNGRPLKMRQAWMVYDSFTRDERVEFLPEPPSIDRIFREHTSKRNQASPKLWADAYLIAFATESDGNVVTFDKVMARRGPAILLS